MPKLRNRKPRRVVVTGLGVVSSLGIGWEPFWKNLMAGKSGISRITAFDTSKYDRHYAGEVKDFDPTKFMNKKKAAQLGRASQMAIAASKLAVMDAKLKLEGNIQNRMGVCIGTTVGELPYLEKYHDNPVNVLPSFFSNFSSSSLAANVALELKLHGYNRVFATACSAGNYAVGQAYDFIRMGMSDYMLAGGSDAFSRVIFTGFERLFAIAPEKCQPFDINRKGMLVGEGSGMVLLEDYENAISRNAHVYAEIVGYGLSCDAYNMTEPSIEGVIKVLKRAIINSGLEYKDVNYVSAHGTGTKENDKVECLAFKRVFGKIRQNIPISSIKSALGHTMGAASALETIVCCLVINMAAIPPTINYEEIDPDCNVDCVPNVARRKEVNIVLNNSQAFGGNNACLVIKKVNG